MPAVVISILQVVDDTGCPEIVEGELIDRFGKAWRFVEKLPIIEAKFSSDNLYPRPGTIACQIIATMCDDQGRAFAQIDTEFPWHVEAIDKVTQFEMFLEQLID